MKSTEILEKLLNRSDKLSLLTLNQILKFAIPFNAPHGFNITEINADEVRIKVPHRKLNHNHLGTIHACAIATVGEFCAGMTLVKKFGMSKYRLILKELHVEYLLQARTDLSGVSTFTDQECSKVKAELAAEGKVFSEHKTHVFNNKQEKVAIVTTKWQLKAWDKVQLR